MVSSVTIAVVVCTLFPSQTRRETLSLENFQSIRNYFRPKIVQEEYEFHLITRRSIWVKRLIEKTIDSAYTGTDCRQFVPELEMNDVPFDDDRSPNSISGKSAALFVAQDSSLASVLRSHNVTVRDFVLMSFLNDQGVMSNIQLASIIGVERSNVMDSLTRLVSEGLVLCNSKDAQTEAGVTFGLTENGQSIVGRINDQL